jgi:hypothetical protein
VKLQKLLVLTFMAVFPGMGLAADLHTYQGKAAEFVIAIPTNWAEMDPQVLEAMVDPYGADDSTSTGRSVRYGYGPPISENMTNPPYIMVEVSKTFRLPDRLEALQANEGFLRTNIGRGLRKSGVLERNLLECHYDTNRHMARFTFTRGGAFVREKLRVVKQVFFTEEGSIIVMAVCRDQEWNNWSGDIESAFGSCQVAERLRYRPRAFSASSSHGGGLQSALITLAVFVVIPIAYMIYNRKAGEVMSDEI